MVWSARVEGLGSVSGQKGVGWGGLGDIGLLLELGGKQDRARDGRLSQRHSQTLTV